jgi:hypothetical protein
LTWGQQDIWRVLEARRPAAGPLVVTRVVRLRPGCVTEDVLTAIRRLVERHESLRSTFATSDDTGPYQVVHPRGEIVVPICDVTAEQVPMVVEDYLADQMDATFHHETQWPARFAMIRSDGRPAVVCLSVAHLAADGWAVQLICQELLDLVDGLEIDEDRRHQPLDQAAYEESEAGRRIAAAAQRYWHGQLMRVPQAMFDVGDKTGTTHLVPAAELTSGRVFRASHTLAERLGVTASAVVHAAVAILMGVHTGCHDVVFHVLVGNRFERSARRAIGTYVQTGLVVIDVGDGSMADVVRRVELASLRAYRHSRYPPDRIAEVLDEVNRRRGLRIVADSFFHNDSEASQLASAHPRSSAMIDSVLRWTMVGASHATFFCYLRADRNATVLRIRLASGSTGPSAAEAIARGVEDLLDRSVDGELTVADIRRDIAVEPVRRGAGARWMRSSWIDLDAIQAIIRRIAGIVDCHLVFEPSGEPELTAHLLMADDSVDPAAVVAAFREHLSAEPAGCEPDRFLFHTGPAATAAEIERLPIHTDLALFHDRSTAEVVDGA